MKVTDNFGCKVNGDDNHVRCEIDQQRRTITIKQAIETKGRVTVELSGIRNPIKNRQAKSGFLIMTFADDRQKVAIDRLEDYLMLPSFECNYPCKKCHPENKDFCTECWLAATTK